MTELFKELLSYRLYKNSQGRLVRRLTMIAIVVLFASGAYKFTTLPLDNIPVLGDASVLWMIAGLLTLFGWWIGFRAINYPPFADFLISVEAEMVKVSWPSYAELYSSTLVVIVMFLILSALIFAFDLVWFFIFHKIGIIA